MKEFQDEAVASKYDDYPEKAQRALLQIRELIFSTAQNLSEVKSLEETLKWGEPSYLPAAKNVGTTIRIDYKDKNPEAVSVFLSCKTTLIEDIKAIHGNIFKYVGKREILLDLNKQLPKEELSHIFSMALTYHLKKI